MSTYFITGISTDVGKTIAASIIVEALEADYWKPIQAGDLENSDTHKVRRFITNDRSQFYDSAYTLHTPMSPHAAAAIDGITIEKETVKRPETKRHLVIEGAGGLLVPINDTRTIMDLIHKADKVVIVSRHYLGSINHTLLTIAQLKQNGYHNLGLIFSGAAHPSTETIITRKTKIPVIGRIDEENHFDQKVIRKYADLFREKLVSM